MALAIGGNSVNKAYLGSTEVQKMYLGADLVFSNGLEIPTGIKLTEAGSVLTPIMTNFRVEDANKDRVLFDSTADVTGLTTTGFVIHGDQTANAVWENLITGVTVDGDGLGGYFTLSKSLTFWDNHIIRLGENTNLTDVNPTVRNFTLTEIINNIPEPDASSDRFASVSGDGLQNGESEANAWTLAEAADNAIEGQTVWVKAGNYGSTVYEFNNIGTATNPIKFIGYTATTGDIDYTNDFVDRFTNYGDSAARMAYIDDTTYPVLAGNNTDNGLETRNASYLIFRNFQANNHFFGFYNATNSDAIIFENCMSGNNYDTGSSEGRSFMADNRYNATRLRWIRNVGFDNSLNCMHADGEHNLIKDNLLVSGVFQSYSCDYWIAQNGGSNSMFINNELRRVENPSHDGHAVGFKPQPRWVDSWGTLKSQYNLVEGHTTYDISEGLLAAFDLCAYNVYKDNDFINDEGQAKECEMMVARDGSRYNIFERNSGNHLEMGALLARVDEFYPETGNEFMSLGNIFRNNLMIDPLYTIQMTHRNPNIPGELKIEDNLFYNNTIIRPSTLFRRSHTSGLIAVINSEFKNNIVWSEIGDNPTRYGAESEPTDYTEEYNDYYQTGWTITGTGNFEVDPNFDVNYKPQADFSTIDVPRIDGVYYGKNGNERQDPTTVGSVLSAEEVAVDPPLYPQSPYTETVTIPAYDSGNPAHKLITPINNGWSDINDPTITSFYVEPGDYLSTGIIQLTADGTSGAKRYISLHNGNDTHPGKIWPDTNSLAQARFNITGDYWVLDRMANWTNPAVYSDRTITINGGQNNIINRQLQDNNEAGMVYIFEGSHNNTIQNFRTQRDDYTLWADQAMIGITVSDLDNGSVMNTKILNGECYNAVDAVQTIKTSPPNNLNSNFEGTIMDYNHFYIDELIYSNGSGVQDDNGKYAFSENAIDLKGGSTNPANPVVITNNKMWGYRQSDETGTGLEDNGWAIVTHFDVANVVIEDNVMFDTNKAVGANATGVETGKSMLDTTIKRNIVKDTLGTALGMYTCENIQIEDNLFVNTSYDTTDFYDWVFQNNNNGTYKNNIRSVIGCGTNTQNTAPINQDILDNTYWSYTDIRFADDPSDIIAPSDPTANYTDLVFTTDIYTNSPREITVTKVLKP